MSLYRTFELMGMVAATVLPLFHIPLICKVVKRKSSKDISIIWVSGIWSCFIIMAPYAIISPDIVLKTFNLIQLAIFSIVAFVVIKYRKG